ncbi:40s ribosomal protein S15 [Castilleja foliolosa]|uniref:40s ribosomal protein S15 n=1 Tax=Castilleja foliolosa TaxID=1961234 RepID=A0ABD3E444_9LAMI
MGNAWKNDSRKTYDCTNYKKRPHDSQYGSSTPVMYGIFDKGGVFLLIGHIGLGWTSNCFDLNYLENALCI